MRSSPALVAIDTPVESSHTSADVVTRTLVELIETLSDATIHDSDGRNSSEEVLVDTEVGGSRYLLLRMPKPNRNRVQLSPREQEIVAWLLRAIPTK